MIALTLLTGKLAAIWFKKHLILAAAPLFFRAPDRVSSSDAYANRFRGAIGKWHLDIQRAAMLDLLRPWPQGKVLDVGGGHGQYAGDLVDRHYRLTVLGSAAETSHRIEPLVTAGKCRFEVGHFFMLPYPEHAYDVVVSIRQLSHLEDWEAFLAELCRVADRAVVIDLPVLRSVNCVSRLFFPLKRKIENDSTRPFIVFEERQVRAVLARHGFVTTGRVAQFFLPMALHRLIRWTLPIRLAEGLFRRTGLTRWFGSPVMLRVERFPTGTVSRNEAGRSVAQDSR